MSASPGAGRLLPGPGQGVVWVGEHGAHLMDYATYHLASDRAPAAVASVFAVCQTQPAPKGITARGHLLGLLRRDCRAESGYREQYVPEGGPGMPDVRLMERVWKIVDPLGTETLRLMYRHELTTVDLSHILAMPVEEVARLATRTQDLIETLVSGMDALVHDRHTCPELSPLVEALFPGALEELRRLQELEEAGDPAEPGDRRALPPAGFDDARADLLSHMITCSTCTRPINIRYTVPQMISNPRLAPLTAEVRRQLLDSLPAAAEPPVPRTAALAAEVRDPGPPTRSQEDTQPGRAVRPARPKRSSLPYLPVRPDRSTPHRPVRSDSSDRPDGSTRPVEPDRAERPAEPDRADDPAHVGRSERADHTGVPEKPASVPEKPASVPEKPARPNRANRSDRSTHPYLPVLADRSAVSSAPAQPVQQALPLSAPPVSGQDTPLYDALLSQAWARNAGTNDMTATLPAIPAVTGGPGSGQTPVVRAYPETIGAPEEVRFGPGVRFVEALAWAGERVRSTTIKIIIIVVAGATGTLIGMNLLGPVIRTEQPSASLQSTTTTTQTAATGAAPIVQGGLAERLRIPPVVTLDEFGQGSLVLTVSGDSLDWRITAPGLVVSPSSGTLKQGRTDVITLRAQRIRNWCGNPSSVTAPLTVHGPSDSITTTVRWRTC